MRYEVCCESVRGVSNEKESGGGIAWFCSQHITFHKETDCTPPYPHTPQLCRALRVTSVNAVTAYRHRHVYCVTRTTLQ